MQGGARIPGINVGASVPGAPFHRHNRTLTVMHLAVKKHPIFVSHCISSKYKNKMSLECSISRSQGTHQILVTPSLTEPQHVPSAKCRTNYASSQCIINHTPWPYFSPKTPKMCGIPFKMMHFGDTSAVFAPKLARGGRDQLRTNPSQCILRGVFCGATGNRTRDTRIFSPLLYQLSYDTIFVPKMNLRTCCLFQRTSHSFRLGLQR